jgi:hypothetical protein
MNIRSVIFTVILVFLVSFFYAASSVSDACAAPREEGWGSSTCNIILDGERKACCWHEATGDLVCQICDVDGTNCDPPIVDKGPKDTVPGGALQESPRDLSPGGEDLQEPTIDPGPKAGDFPEDLKAFPNLSQNVIPKGGPVLEQSSEDKIVPPQVNGLSNNSNGTLAMDYIKESGKIEIPNLNILPNTTKSENGEEIDENEPTIKEDGQAGPQENASTMEKEQKDPLTTFLEKNLNNAKDLPSQLKMVKQVKDPYKKLVLLTGIMEEQGKVPPETTKALNSVLQGDANALDELCNILSTNQGINIAADICTAFPEQGDNVRASMIEYALVTFLISIAEEFID